MDKYKIARSRVLLANSLTSQAPNDHQQEAFLRTRLSVFCSILFGYSCYYLTRNSLTFTAPAMVASPTLNLDITSIGVITSIFPLCYGCSKFVSGVVGDVLSPSLMLGGGLIATGMVNIAFGASSTLPIFCILWAMNGILQGFGAPSCAKILTSWFAASERGTYWGMWNIAHNLGGFLAPILAGTAARIHGWSWGLWAPGVIALIVGSIIVCTLKDSPEDKGFAPVEPDLNIPTNATKPAESEQKLSLVQNLLQNVLSNPFIWGLAFTYFCVYVVRQGITSWSVFYLIKEKGVVDAGAAAVRVSGLELGGLLGSLLAGRISDSLISKTQDGSVGQRIRVVMAYLLGVTASLIAFKFVPASWPVTQAAIVFMIGFFLYGPQMLIGLCGAEIVGRRSVGASEGFLGWIAYLGAANAGVPLSLLVQQYGWDAFFAALLSATAVGILLLAPMIDAKSYLQRKQVYGKGHILGNAISRP
ncbi:Major facilitator superfamily domain, general substrate transporter [Ostreococcus tauri]|uniref:Major facilitator superfamily domain, general substrate transporter n=1 Tax=Ostreococcus tauri TaxID=70448 RepID=A0A090M789_OSTTA|nr:Major facilitator superfamily domain, general substrate transporter [Ostreococcus tauri]CEG00957.1 Major facilitator superfamily domain, general substrate transporter [Ostreococcus tauri]|eukprot:XP_003074878.2 Major facilitator superfamily domain, general substrate transporter [Ostreococcus tauri]